MEQLFEWMEIIEDVRQHRKVRHRAVESRHWHLDFCAGPVYRRTAKNSVL